MGKLKAHIHNHTEYSLKDGVCDIEMLVKKSKELGFSAVAITDHGVVIGQRKFYEACIKEGIKPILGVELYFLASKNQKDKSHMLALAINETGYKALCEMVSDANKNPYIVKYKGKEKAYPIVTPELLYMYFGPDAVGHGNVIFTTACVGGFLSPAFAKNEKKKREINKLKSQIEKTEGLDIEDSLKLYDSIVREYDELNREIKKIEKLFYIDLNELSKVITTQKVGTNSHRQNIEKFNEAKRIQKEESEKSIKDKKAALEVLKNKKTAMKSVADKYKKDNARNKEKLGKIEELKKELLDNDEIKYKMAWVLLSVGDIVGNDNLYVELQYHNLDIEREEKLLELAVAKEFNFKTCLSNDVHYINKEDSLIRKVNISLENKEYKEDREDEGEYYLKTEEELVAKLSDIYNKEDIDIAITGTNEICDRINLTFTSSENRPVFITPDGYTSEEYMVLKLKEGIKKKFPNGFPEVEAGEESYIERLNREYQTIKKMGFVDYILIVMDYVQEAKKEKYNGGMKYSCNVGPGRGSGAGSLVNFLLDITDVDPIKYGLIFERFLNPERITMPDIDVDFAIDIRKDIISYVKEKHGEDSVCLISTILRQFGKASVRNAARFLILENGEETKEKYNACANRISKAFPRGCQSFFDKVSCDDEECENSEEYAIDILRNEFSSDKTALQILDLAEKMEGLPIGYSTHAAGVIIDNCEVKKHVPLMYNVSNGEMATQCDMVEAEGCFNLLKMDFLGLKTLNIQKTALKLIYDRYGKEINLSEIPIEKEVFDEIIGNGKTVGIFQLESPGMRKFMMKLRPESIEDLTAGISLYRPGPLEFIPKFLEGKRNPSNIKYDTERLEPILKNTYGVIIYQEQVIRIVRELAGYSLGRSDLVRRAMAKKKSDVMEKEKQVFIYGNDDENIPGCVKNGILAETASRLFDSMIDFSRYAFNKSHGVCYSKISYQMAWLKHYYPLEFYTALLKYSNKSKYQKIISEAKKEGIRFKTPSIMGENHDFHINNEESIVFSLRAIDGINDIDDVFANLRIDNGMSFDDVLYAIVLNDKSSKINERNIEFMIKAGVFDNININRKALLDTLSDKLRIIRKIVKLKESCDAYSDTEERGLKQLLKQKNEIENLKIELKNIPFSDDEYTELEKLNNEKSVLNVFLSGHPLDEYAEYTEGFEPIEDLVQTQKMIRIYGYVGSVSEKKRRKDDKKFCTFELDGQNGSIDVCVFVREYEKFNNMIVPNSVMAFEGTVIERENIEINDDGEEEVVKSLSFIAKNIISPPEPEKKDILIHVNSFDEWKNKLYNEIVRYKTESNGTMFYVHDRSTGLIRKGSFRINTEALNNEYIEYLELNSASYT